MITMTFYTTTDSDGNIHVQNAVQGMLGQHHVHSPAGFERWKQGDGTFPVREESVSRLGGVCDCGLRPGDVRDHTGGVSHRDAYA